VYLDLVFGQWTTRAHGRAPLYNNIPAKHLHLVVNGAIKPSPYLLHRYIDPITKYYDDQLISVVGSSGNMNNPPPPLAAPPTATPLISPPTTVIGIHLRIESDIGNRCGNVTTIVDRLCHQLELPCNTSICIVATGSSRREYEQYLPCKRILTKDESWTTKNEVSPLLSLSREEAAMIDLWTVTRAHIVTGCTVSTMSLTAYSLHAPRLEEWRHHNNPLISSIATSITINETGAFYYDPIAGCTTDTQLWINNHHLTEKGISCSNTNK
jgi:hypothetical protein